MAHSVPVIDIHKGNFKELWPAVVVSINSASFIALDTELSGLGNRKSLLAESIEDRYKAICLAARSRSILSLGIACFKTQDNKAADTYLVQVYNLTLLCSEEYTIEPQSVQFLVQHGFDFNKQYSHGITYYKGNNKGGVDDRGVHIRALFTQLLRAKKPLVLHNGLIDIAFLYQSFYAQLPDRLVTFTADLSEMFPAGIYDTKYVTEFELRLPASYLEYAFKKCKLDNSRSLNSEETGPHVHVEFCQYDGQLSTYVDYREFPASSPAEGQTEICQPYSAFGWCPNGVNCQLSHNTDLIILQDEKSKAEQKKKRKRQRAKKKNTGAVEGDCSVPDGSPQTKKLKKESGSEELFSDSQASTNELHQGNKPQVDEKEKNRKGEKCEELTLKKDEKEVEKTDGGGNGTCADKAAPSELAPTTLASESKPEDGIEDKLRDPSPQIDVQKKNSDAGTHRAGFDAYMTAYIFAYSCALSKREQLRESKEQGESPWLPTCLNKIYLSGKAAPLNVVKSSFSKSSKAHVQKMKMVWGVGV